MVTIAKLEEFCSADRDRHYFRHLWSRGEFTYSTNGHVLIRVPRLDNVGENELAPDCDRFFVKALTQAKLMSVPAFDIPEIEDEDCEACDGSGLAHHDCPACECVCDDCEGSGFKKYRFSVTSTTLHI